MTLKDQGHPSSNLNKDTSEIHPWYKLSRLYKQNVDRQTYGQANLIVRLVTHNLPNEFFNNCNLFNTGMLKDNVKIQYQNNND